MTETQKAACIAALDALERIDAWFKRRNFVGLVPNEVSTLEALRAALAEPAVEPVAQLGVGNSGFDHKTAADFLSGKNVSDENVRRFVAQSRWAHDDSASLRALTANLRQDLALRDVEIALLKQSLLDAEAQQPADPVVEPVAWQPIDTAPKGRIVLVHYKNCLGRGRTMRARYYLPETLESDTTESGWADEGWYEESDAYEYLMPLDYDPTHWMPMPSAPDAQQPAEVPLKQIAEALRQHGLTLIKKANGYDVMQLGNIEAQEQAAVRQKAGLK